MTTRRRDAQGADQRRGGLDRVRAQLQRARGRRGPPGAHPRRPAGRQRQHRRLVLREHDQPGARRDPDLSGVTGDRHGTFEPGDVQAVPAQGVGANEFAELVRALRAGVAYANVHTARSTGRRDPRPDRRPAGRLSRTAAGPACAAGPGDRLWQTPLDEDDLRRSTGTCAQRLQRCVLVATTCHAARRPRRGTPSRRSVPTARGPRGPRRRRRARWSCRRGSRPPLCCRGGTPPARPDRGSRRYRRSHTPASRDRARLHAAAGRVSLRPPRGATRARPRPRTRPAARARRRRPATRARARPR